MKDFAAEREIKSFWWTPNRPETRWFGTLTLARGAMPHLELVAEGTDLFDDHMPLGRVLHGEDEDGKSITLVFASGPRKTADCPTARLRASRSSPGLVANRAEFAPENPRGEVAKEPDRRRGKRPRSGQVAFGLIG